MKQGQTLKRPLLKAKHFARVAKTSAHFDDYISEIYTPYNKSEDAYSVLAARDENRKDTYTEMSLGPSETQGFASRSRRTTPARRGVGTRDARADESRKPEGSSDKVRELELQLELLKLKQAKGPEEVQQARAEDDEDEEW